MMHEDEIEEAREIARALALARVGGVSAMANAESVEHVERILDDGDMVHAVVSWLANAVVMLAGAMTDEDPDATPAVVRNAFNADYQAYPRPDDA